MAPINQINSRSSANQAATFTGACLNSCRKVIAQMQRTRERVVSEFKASVQEHSHLLELAVNEAEALAWQSGFPQLLFADLAEENARRVATWHQRQHQLRPERAPHAAAA